MKTSTVALALCITGLVVLMTVTFLLNRKPAVDGASPEVMKRFEAQEEASHKQFLAAEKAASAKYAADHQGHRDASAAPTMTRSSVGLASPLTASQQLDLRFGNSKLRAYCEMLDDRKISDLSIKELRMLDLCRAAGQ